jgi:multidrug efflux pump subunit AcrA (membrane-fusion protein)
MVRRESRSVMTRLQNAKNQLSEALAALESAASQAVCPSGEPSALASSSINDTQAAIDADLSVFVDEVGIIEAKLSQAMTMITSLELNAVSPGTFNDGEPQ